MSDILILQDLDYCENLNQDNQQYKPLNYRISLKAE